MSIGVTLFRLAVLSGIALTSLSAQSPAQIPAPSVAQSPPQIPAQTPAQTPAQSLDSRSCWLRDAASPGGSVVYALCEQGALFATADAGATWTKRFTGAANRLRAMAFLDAKRGFVIGDRATVLSTGDGGQKWEVRKVDTKEHLMDISFVGESGWIVGYQGIILHTRDGGRTWEKQNAKTTQTLETVFFLDPDHGWVVGWSGTILRTVDGGQNWQTVRCDAAQWSLTAVYFKDPLNGWMVGFAGQIFRSKDGGVTWQAQASPVKSWLTNIAFDASNRGWMTYDDGFLLSEDGGETWKAVPAAGRYFLSKLQRVNNSLWAFGQTTVLRQADGLKWEKIQSLVTDTTTTTNNTTSPATTSRPGGATNPTPKS
ncbi:MAG TPA: YCF48-related protein [Bryobacteraceae bacterium]|nr:YCF48-related protein [Bryobacteraceae bacterium]